VTAAGAEVAAAAELEPEPCLQEPQDQPEEPPLVTVAVTTSTSVV
jgi:hypothetical protein